jgi:hypothetical protein
MKHICIYTTPDVFEHKRNDGRLFWEFASRPKILDEHEKREIRIYFAFKKQIRGYFIIDEVRYHDQVEWYGDSWVEIDPIDQRPFQGFKYLEVK